jgi:hypothetical protein
VFSYYRSGGPILRMIKDKIADLRGSIKELDEVIDTSGDASNPELAEIKSKNDAISQYIDDLEIRAERNNAIINSLRDEKAIWESITANRKARESRVCQRRRTCRIVRRCTRLE